MRPPVRPLAATAAAVGVALVLTGCGLGALPSTISSPAPILPAASVEMTMFAPEYADPSRLDASAADIDVVSVASVAVTGNGTTLTPTDPRVLAMEKHAHALGKTTTLLVTNSVPGVGFSQSLAGQLLGTAANRDAVAKALADRVEDEKWDGILLDFESLSRDQASGLVDFARTLRADVGRHVRLDAAIMTATTPSGYLQRGYDVKKLVRSLDHLTLMAYDEHGTWSPNDPGPIGSLAWQRSCLTALLKLIPSDKVDLGVAGYGYRWLAPDGPHSLSDRQARELVANTPGTVVTWDSTAKEWHATLPDGQVAWWSDAKSLAYRVTLAKALHLHGVAVWSLAVSDPITAR